VPERAKIVIAVIISNYSFLILLLCANLAGIIVCSGAPAAHLDNTADFYNLPGWFLANPGYFSIQQGANISYGEVPILAIWDFLSRMVRKAGLE